MNPEINRPSGGVRGSTLVLFSILIGLGFKFAIETLVSTYNSDSFILKGNFILINFIVFFLNSARFFHGAVFYHGESAREAPGKWLLYFYFNLAAVVVLAATGHVIGSTPRLEVLYLLLSSINLIWVITSLILSKDSKNRVLKIWAAFHSGWIAAMALLSQVNLSVMSESLFLLGLTLVTGVLDYGLCHQDFFKE